MPDPQVNERVKDAPVRALRAMFAGIGSLLSITDKIRNKPAATATTATMTPDTATPEDTVTPETATPEGSVAPETATPETAAPETVVAETMAPETSAAPETATGLPVANYDQLSVASLRARLRNLTPEHLAQLIEHEKTHAARADVITMFERRIAKLKNEA